ncbi:MAG TPA: PAS domain S-box protein [Terriglobales bacterium]|nr:PAS domain S-box protein [Terriglobales bacterium]
MSVADRWERVGTSDSYRLRTWPARYGVAVLTVAAATLLEFGLHRLQGPYAYHPAFILYYPAVVLVAMWAGFFPGIAATALSATVGGFLFLEPSNSFALRTPENVAAPALFAIIGVFLTVLTASRNQATHALRVSEAELNRAQVVAHIGSWHLDIDQGTLRLSDEAYRILGLPLQAQLSPHQAREIVHPEDRARVDAAWKAVVESRRYDEENRVLLKGHTRWVRIQASVECDPSGRPTKAVGTVQDITDAKLTRERNAEFEKVVESLDEMIAVVDRDYRYVIANQAFLNHRQAKKEDVVGRNIWYVVNPESLELVKNKLDECFQGKVVQYEMRYRYPVLGERDLFISYFPIEGPTRVERVACILQDLTERKRAEHSLRLFRTLIDQSNDAVEVVDPETVRFLDVNDRACKDLGYTREELLSMTVFDINPGLDEPRRLKVQEKLRTQGFLVQQGLHLRKDGTTFPVETSLRMVQLDRTYVVAVSRDITDRKLAENALRASEDRYRDLVDHSEDLVCTHDLQGRLLSVNPAPARILGYEVEEMLKIPMRDLIIPEGRELFDAYLERLKTTGAPERGLLCVLTKTGEVRTWEYCNTLRTEGVQTPVVRGMAHDVTDRRRAELALGDSEQRYRILFEKTVAGVGIITLDGKLIDCNDAWAHMFGYANANECRGTTVGEHYFDPIDREALLEELKSGGAITGRELHLRRTDGTPFWLLVNDVLLPDGQNRTLIQATVIDITARKRAEQAMRDSEERFRVALKNSPIVVFSQDRDLRYTWIYNFASLAPDEVIGKTDDEIVGKDQARHLKELKKRVLETGLGVREEVDISYKGGVHSFDITIEPLFDVEKKIVGITGASMDIARLRELADTLRDAKERLVQEKSYLESEIEAELGFEEIIGQSPALREVLKKARVVAPIDSTVLLLGESGTGKELVARAVHALSSRHERSFIKLNCAAVPSGLLESELFGHERGAFTGAVSQKVGRVELADKGTLFLDEIGELPLELQPKLLRLLQDREFERLGGVQTLRVDVRIISATNRDLAREVAERNFREDLFYRLNVFPLQLPSLRERRSDIPVLVQHFVRKHSARMGKHIDVVPNETLQVLQSWNWPGNIRELENMVERMVILSKGRVLAAPPEDLGIPQEIVDDDNLTEMERDHIIRILRETNGVLSGVDGAANRLGIKRTTLQSMLKRFGIEPRDYRRGTGTYGAE